MTQTIDLANISRKRKENDMGIYIPNIEKPKSCLECWSSGLSGVINCEAGTGFHNPDGDLIPSDCPLIEIDLVRCGECKHKPIKYDPEGDDFGFNLVSPNGYDNLCPCLNTDDGFYSYMPEDNFFCAYGERRE